MRMIFKIFSRLLALLTIILFLLYFYGEHLYEEALDKQDAMDTEIKSGNGFGGEAGMKIIDSKYSSRDFFWVTENLLLFKTLRKTDANGYNKDHYIWDIEANEIIPLEIPGLADCEAHGHLYFLKLLNPDRPKGARTHHESYQADLVREADRWNVSNIVNTNKFLAEAPPRYHLEWRGGRQCKSWYHLPRENRTTGDVPRHHFDYLSEWGWIYRRPSELQLKHGEQLPEMGFFDIGTSLYYGQNGVKVRKTIDLPAHYQKTVRFEYLPFLDKYWLATVIARDDRKPKFLGVLQRNGIIHNVKWTEGWKLYNAIPLPTKKGLFWSADDYRHSKPGLNHRGGFLRTQDDVIHKVIHGQVERMELSPDGCKLAFFSDNKHYETGDSKLRIFDVCNSSIQGREMRDVQY